MLPHDGILGIKILTEQKLRLDEGYLQINNKKIKLKPAHKLNHNLNIVTENPQKTDREFKSRVKIEQKEFLKKVLKNTDEKQNLTPVVHKDSQQVAQVNEKTENFQVKDEMEKSSCLISYEPELIDKDKVNIKSEITFYDDVTKILNTISILEAEGKDLEQNMLNEILPERINDLHYEKILESNENNIKSLINNINIAFENKNQAIDFEEIGSTDYKQFLTIINKRMEVDFEEYNELDENEKEYNFISYEIDNLPEGFQVIDDFNINENEILNLGSINVIEKKDQHKFYKSLIERKSY